MMRGTATIWVDKGIKVEKGVGYPDRVMGSSFFIDRRGYLLTNHHVIESEVDPEYEGYSRLYIRMPGKSEEKIPAKVVGWDRIFDIALVKIEVEPKFVFSPFSRVSVKPGEQVFVIGSPVDPFLENTITSGIISAVGRRKLLQMGDVLQLDAPVNPGNSGGPLVNDAGDLVGVVFAGLRPFEGLNFAIPIGWISRLIPRLYAGGGVAHSWLGLSLTEKEDGLEITYALPGEPAHRAGVRAGDRLESINGRQFNTIKDVQSFLMGFPAETLVSVAWSRDGETTSGVMSLRKRPFSPIELAIERDSKLNILLPLFGMSVKQVGTVFMDKNYIVDKVIQGSIADNSGISVRDPINLQRWDVDLEKRLVYLRIYIKKKKAGFFESVLQLAAYMELDNFI
jgi:S1-C subfamily serine protease